MNPNFKDAKPLLDYQKIKNLAAQVGCPDINNREVELADKLVKLQMKNGAHGFAGKTYEEAIKYYFNPKS